MTTEQKALALLNEVLAERVHWQMTGSRTDNASIEALCRAIEQHEAFRQEVSDAVGDALFMAERHCECDNAYRLAGNRLGHLIIPKPKPDPLVEVLNEMEKGRAKDWAQQGYADNFRAALDALGLEIREKGQ